MRNIYSEKRETDAIRLYRSELESVTSSQRSNPYLQPISVPSLVNSIKPELPERITLNAPSEHHSQNGRNQRYGNFAAPYDNGSNVEIHNDKRSYYNRERESAGN